MESKKMSKLLIANLIVSAILIIMVVLLLKWSIPSTKYEGQSLIVNGSRVGVVVSTTDLPGNRIRIVFEGSYSVGSGNGYRTNYSVFEGERDSVRFEQDD